MGLSSWFLGSLWLSLSLSLLLLNLKYWWYFNSSFLSSNSSHCMHKYQLSLITFVTASQETGIKMLILWLWQLLTVRNCPFALTQGSFVFYYSLFDHLFWIQTMLKAHGGYCNSWEYISDEFKHKHKYIITLFWAHMARQKEKVTLGNILQIQGHAVIIIL